MAEQEITGYIEVQQSAEDRETRRVGWTGPWPPPEEMVLVVGKFADHHWTITEESPDNRAALQEGKARGMTITRLARETYSRLPAGLSHVVRGSLYRRAGEWTPTIDSKD